MTSAPIRFLLNQQEVCLTEVNPNTTLLQFIRGQQLVGTKEGCASGDCGACTVVLAESVAGELQYRAINACIALLATLHGKQVITVEYLKQQQHLHPVQQAMVAEHGSQCGYCTPGFVMSMFALYQQQQGQKPSRHQVLDALAGNLCRCTGYRAIIDAALSVADSDDNYSQALFAEQQQQVNTRLQQLQQIPMTVLHGAQGSFYAPNTLDALAECLVQHPKAAILAGGTDLALQITQQLQQYDEIVYLGAVPELNAIVENEQEFCIGAAVNYQRFAPVLEPVWPELFAMVQRIGSAQIRELGTLGGNIGNASPIGDMPPVLLALGATLTLRCGDKVRQLPIADFYLGYKQTVLQAGEFIQQIHIPKPAEHETLSVYKVSKRLDDDISAVLAAVSLQIVAGRVASVCIAFGGMAAIPKRAMMCEQALLQQPWQQSSVDKAKAALSQDFQPLSDVRASADYRLQVAQNLLQKCFIEWQQQKLASDNRILTRVSQHA